MYLTIDLVASLGPGRSLSDWIKHSKQLAEENKANTSTSRCISPEELSKHNLVNDVWISIY
ncbi:hypothetical protein GJ496_010749, partial [Pomphorhynchus laevis]